MSENKGFITLDRSILDHWCSQDPNFLSVWVRLLLEANYKSKTIMFNGIPLTIERGQLIYGRESFSERSRVSVSKLRRIIKILEKEKQISQQKTNKYTIISITNYEDYQNFDQQNPTTQPDSDQEATTSKQSKQVKQDSNIRAVKKTRKTQRPKDFNPNLDNAREYWKSKGRLDLIPLASDIADEFITDRGAKGVTYVDWEAGWRTWYCNAVKFNKAPDQSRHMERSFDFGGEDTDQVKVTIKKPKRRT